MTKLLAVVLLLLLIIMGLQYFSVRSQRAQTALITPSQTEAIATPTISLSSKTPTSTKTTMSIPSQKIISQKLYNAQTFNNCGPANLAMLFSYAGIEANQNDLGKKLRPYQVAGGDNDDKSVSMEELVEEAQARGLIAYYRPNGNAELIKQFIANDIPVVAKQWLHENEDIGHYRLIRGYNNDTKEFISDDSYIGPNQRFHYDVFNRMWEPFNYEYMIVAPKEKQSLVGQILGNEIDATIAWRHANDRALDQLKQTPENTYALFNLSTSYYYLGEYQKSIDSYEKVAPKLTSRMLWYQIEPIQSYAKLNFNNKVLAMTQAILQNNNLAFSELYVLRAEVFLQQGEKAKAAEELSKARKYNQNLKIPKELFDQTKN